MFRYFLLSLLTVFLLPTTTQQLVSAEAPPLPTTTNYVNESVVPWRNLKPSNEFPNADGIKFFRLKTDNGSAACLVVLNLRDKRYMLKPFFNTSLDSTSNAARRNNALVATNGGYFNLSNGESTSYVVIDGKEQCDPKTNKDLVENPEIQPYLETIFNRSQVTFVRYLTGEAAGRTIVQFGNHTFEEKKQPPAQYQESSLQAGPRLLPILTDKDEAFVRTDSTGKVVDAIGSHKTAARTAFGLTPDGYAVLLCIACRGQDEFSSGVTLAQLAKILKTLGCSEAINFDGGTSTTMIIRRNIGSDSENPASKILYQQVCGKFVKAPEKLVKSGLMILPVIE